MFAADFALGEALWSIFAIFMFVIWFWLIISVFSDLFRDHETSGWAKALWMLFIVFLPYLGIFVYLIARGGGMAERQIRAQQAAKEDFDSYVRTTAGTGGPAAELSQAKELLDNGTITEAEFAAMKAKIIG
jgi:hypothetical protein